MAGTAKNYDPVDVPQGPAELWLDCSTPADGATIVLHTDGTPDGLTNASALFVGKVKDGVKFSVKPKINEFFSDESTSPFRTGLEAEDAMLEGEWMQLQNSALLLRMLPGGTRTTGSGFERVTVGGLVEPATYNVTLIWPQFGVPGKYISLQLYKAINLAGWEASIGRKIAGSSPFQFKALSVDTRTAGDRVYALNKQL